MICDCFLLRADIVYFCIFVLMNNLYRILLFILLFGCNNAVFVATAQDTPSKIWDSYDTIITMRQYEICDSTIFEVIDSVIEAESLCNYYTDSICIVIVVDTFSILDTNISYCYYAFWMDNYKDAFLVEYTGFFQYDGIICFVRTHRNTDLTESIFREREETASFFYHYNAADFYEDDSHSYNIYAYWYNRFIPLLVQPCHWMPKKQNE